MDEMTAAAGSDRDLARAAQLGDAAALGLLFERHRARLYAHALQLLGHGPDAQDAVQDAFVIAIRRIGGLRDPSAAEGWLHTVLRSVCFTRLRGASDVPVAEVPDEPTTAGESPEAAIDALALRDWVWTAIDRLSDPLRIVMMLRHFSSSSSYGEIASICGVPVGTVRSRLSEGRRRLGEELRQTADAAHDEAAARHAAAHERIMSSCTNMTSFDLWLSWVDRHIEVRSVAGAVLARGRDEMEAGLYEDSARGVTFVPTEVLAGPGLTIVEARFVNPPDDPYHCPPATTQLHFDRDGLTHRMVFHYAPRAPGTARGRTEPWAGVALSDAA